jgi:hypothetical protein
MDHKPHDRILTEIEKAKVKIEVGADYAHYKNPDKIYRVTGFGTLEADDELCVIYESRYLAGLTFIRPVQEWTQKIQWQGKPVLRFTKLKT